MREPEGGKDDPVIKRTIRDHRRYPFVQSREGGAESQFPVRMDIPSSSGSRGRDIRMHQLSDSCGVLDEAEPDEPAHTEIRFDIPAFRTETPNHEVKTTPTARRMCRGGSLSVGGSDWQSSNKIHSLTGGQPRHPSLEESVKEP